MHGTHTRTMALWSSGTFHRRDQSERKLLRPPLLRQWLRPALPFLRRLRSPSLEPSPGLLLAPSLVPSPDLSAAQSAGQQVGQALAALVAGPEGLVVLRCRSCLARSA